MRKLEYFYFNIYNHYSRRSFFPDELSVRLQAMYLLCFSAGGWVLLLQAGYLRLIRHSWFSSQPVAMLFAATVYLVLGLVFHKIFIVNEHDQKIHKKYADSWHHNPNKKRDLLLSVLVAIVPYLLLISLKIIFPRNP